MERSKLVWMQHTVAHSTDITKFTWTSLTSDPQMTPHNLHVRVFIVANGFNKSFVSMMPWYWHDKMCVISWLAPERCGSDSIENILQIKFMSTSVKIALICTRQHWLRELLGVVRQQALTRVTVDPAPYGIIRSWWVKVQCHSPMTFISDLFWTEHSSIKSISCDKNWAIWANGTGKWICTIFELEMIFLLNGFIS